jgi:hypothetical protein
MTKIEYRNRLPHLAPMGATFFVTFRLADALPQSVISELEEEYINERNLFKAIRSPEADSTTISKNYLREPL